LIARGRGEEVKGESRNNDISTAEGLLSREGRRELEGGTQMKVGHQREPGMNGGLRMMKDGGRDLEGRSWRC
jgi:hypothetical protein